MAGDLTGVVFEHNTGFPSYAAYNFEGGTHQGFKFRNNICTQGTYNERNKSQAASPIVQGNVFIGTKVASAGNFVVASIAEMRFTDYTAANYLLQTTSPAM